MARGEISVNNSKAITAAIDNGIIQTGIKFKNYKELCAALNQKPLVANSKKSQIKEWNRYFSFHKVGQSIIITDVFNEPKEIIDKRKTKGIYLAPIEKILISFLLKINGGKYGHSFVSGKNNWCRLFGLINDDFYHYSDFTNADIELSDAFIDLNDKESVKLFKSNFDDFYNRACGKLHNIFANTLNRLEKDGVISFEKVYTITTKTKDKRVYDFVASKEQVQNINDAVAELIQELGYDTTYAALFSLGAMKYYQKLYDKLKKSYGWQKFYVEWRITLINSNRYDKSDILSKEDETQLQQIVNTNFIASLNQAAESCYVNYLKSITDDPTMANQHWNAKFNSGSYIEYQEYLTERFIKLNASVQTDVTAACLEEENDVKSWLFDLSD